MKGRKTYIVFDSDAASNHHIIKAENELARELLNLGAHPYICRMPALLAAPAKTGLDDYLVHSQGGKKRFKEMILERAVEWQKAEMLHCLNGEVVYVKNPGLILKVSNLQRISPDAFVRHLYSHWRYEVQVITANGSRTEERSAAQEWLKWRLRSEVEKVTYAPGKPRITAHGELNVWPGWGCEPIKGDVAPWRELLDHLFNGTPKYLRDWFEKWLAYPLQHPGKKLATAAIVWGTHQGTGKSLVGYTMKRIYGANFGEIEDAALHGNFNEWAENRQFIMGDEIAGGENKRKIADRMKTWITRKEIRINAKYVPEYTVPDCINFYFTSNHPNAFVLPDEDRRFFVHEVTSKPREETFYKTLLAWFEKENGASHLFYHLLQLDTEGFNPDGHAPMTAAKKDMISSTKSEAATWATNLREDADGVLSEAYGPLVMLSLFRQEELYKLFQRAVPDGKVPLMRVVLAEAGIRKVLPQHSGIRVNKGGWGKEYLWAVRDAERLHGLKERAIAQEFLKERSALPYELRKQFGPPDEQVPKYMAQHKEPVQSPRSGLRAASPSKRKKRK